MRILAVLVMAAALAGCASSGAEVHQRCGAGDKPFMESWPCVRAGAASIRTYADLRDLYIATGDNIALQVKEGKMTDAEARLAIAQARQRINDSVAARNGSDVTDAVVLGSILNRPAPTYSAPPIYTAPSAPVNCYRVGATMQCY